MSKSLGNGIDPLDVIGQYGADALRFSLTAGVAAGSDQRYFPEKVESARNFANKIWNASRFVLMNLEGVELRPIGELELDATDKWMLSRLGRAVREVTANIEEFELGIAAQKVYDFIWSDFCDWYIELAKARLYGGDAEEKRTAASVLVYVLRVALKLLHPFMPFVTEAVWKHLPGETGSIMRSRWPEAADIPVSQADEDAVESAKEIITAVRTVRLDMKVLPSKKPALKMARRRGGALRIEALYYGARRAFLHGIPAEGQRRSFGVGIGRMRGWHALHAAG